MKRLARLCLAVVVLLSLAVPVLAEEEETVEPIDYALYLTGEQQISELELPSRWPSGSYRQMSEDEPTSSDAKGLWVTNYAAGPNTNCSGNGLVPTWEVFFEGTITDDVTVVLHAMSAPGARLDVRLFADVGSGMCNDNYKAPIAGKVVEIGSGSDEVEIVFEGVDAVVRDNLTLMVTAGSQTSQSRLEFDSTAAPSRVEVSCIPFDGLDTCLW
jgi:hypothetical protein